MVIGGWHIDRRQLEARAGEHVFRHAELAEGLGADLSRRRLRLLRLCAMMADVSALTLDPDDAHLQEDAAALARRMRLLPGSPAQLVSVDGETIEIPPALFELLAAVAEELGQGHGVSVLPLHRQLTTTEAAQLLNVSRPHVISLLERGDLPFEKVGTHRRVRLADVVAYRQIQDQRRQEALANIVRQGEDLDLAY